MKSYEFEYRGFNGRGPLSHCNVYIKQEGEIFLIGFENIGLGVNTSVTNASEVLATRIVQKEGLNPKKCKFFEWYPEYEGDVDQIIYEWDMNSSFPQAFAPKWIPAYEAKDNPFK